MHTQAHNTHHAFLHNSKFFFKPLHYNSKTLTARSWWIFSNCNKMADKNLTQFKTNVSEIKHTDDIHVTKHDTLCRVRGQTIKFANSPPCACLDKSLSMVWWRWPISVSQLCCWSMAISFWVAYVTVCVFRCAPARMSELELEQRTNIKFLVKLGKSGNNIRQTSVQVYGDNAMKKTGVYKWVKLFLREEKVSLTKRDQNGQQQTELKKWLQKFVKLCVKIIGWL